MLHHALRAMQRSVIRPAFVGAASATPSGSNVVSFSSGAVPDAQAGDLAILFVFDPDSFQTYSAPSGWTLDANSGGSTLSWASYYKTLSSSDVSVSLTMNDTDGGAFMLVFNGFSFGASVAAFTSNGKPDAASLSGFNIGDISVIAAGAERATADFTVAAGYTLVENFIGGAGSSAILMGAYRVATSSGSINPAAFTGGGNAACVTNHVRLTKL